MGEKILLPIPHSLFPTPHSPSSAAIEKFITNNRMRITASSENLDE
jgi:hypothetical protein